MRSIRHACLHLLTNHTRLCACAGGSEGGAGGGEGEERPESFEPAEDPTIRPVVQLAVVAKVTGEEHEQTIYAGGVVSSVLQQHKKVRRIVWELVRGGGIGREHRQTSYAGAGGGGSGADGDE